MYVLLAASSIFSRREIALACVCVLKRSLMFSKLLFKQFFVCQSRY